MHPNHLAAERLATFGDAATNPVAVVDVGLAELPRRYGTVMGLTVLDTNQALPPPAMPAC